MDEQQETVEGRWSSSSPVVYGLLGECLLIHRWLASKPTSLIWAPLKLIDAVLRGFSQVVFANSTISGICVVVGLAIADGLICAAGLLAATLATLTALVIISTNVVKLYIFKNNFFCLVV